MLLLCHEFARAGADIITVHAEAGPHIDRTLHLVRTLGKKAGVAVNTRTSESVLDHILDRVDLVLIMTVNPGFGGQAFIPAMTEKIRRVRRMISGRPIRLEVDGGITTETAAQVAVAGADTLVAGNAVFSGGKYAESIAAIRKSAECAAARP